MRLFYPILALLVLFTTSPLVAQDEEENPLMKKRFFLEAGIFGVTRDFKLGADGQSEGGEIDFNETFNLSDNEPTYFFKFDWRFAKKWMVALETFGVNAGNSLVLEEDITWEDITFEKGSFVRAGVDFRLSRLFFSRTILNRPKHLINVGLGLHAINIGAFIEGEGRTSEGNIEPGKRRVNGLIPLPNIGASYMWAPHRKWMIGANLDWLGLTIDQYSGSLWYFAPKVKFQIVEHFGVGVNYALFSLDAKVDAENWNGRFDMSFSGPLISLHGNF